MFAILHSQTSEFSPYRELNDVEAERGLYERQLAVTAANIDNARTKSSTVVSPKANTFAWFKRPLKKLPVAVPQVPVAVPLHLGLETVQGYVAQPNDRTTINEVADGALPVNSDGGTLRFQLKQNFPSSDEDKTSTVLKMVPTQSLQSLPLRTLQAPRRAQKVLAETTGSTDSGVNTRIITLQPGTSYALKM